jgi:hypothetical protein
MFLVALMGIENPSFEELLVTEETLSESSGFVSTNNPMR